MSFDRLDRTWEHLGSTDPLWAVLTSPDKRFGQWDEAEFFATGAAEVDRILNWVESAAGSHNLTLARGRALDFGCGVGRLSRALGDRFERCDGVDIAQSMIDAAKRLNADAANCEFHLNKSPDLSLFADGSFDFIYTAHVLQHMEPTLQRFYVEEFVRTLRPGGLASFEMVTERRVGASEPLPADAYDTGLALLEPLPPVLAPGQRLALSVQVTNRGPHALPAAGKEGWYQVTVANHWLDGGGRRKINDDGRAELPKDIEPGGQVTVVLDIAAPSEPGAYQLELDCVQEGVAWFGDRGSSTARYSCRVEAPRRRLIDRISSRSGAEQATAPRGHDVETAAMEMHGVAEAEVRSWVEASGGTFVASTSFTDLLDAESPDWYRQIYLVTRRPGGNDNSS